MHTPPALSSTLSLHAALPISGSVPHGSSSPPSTLRSPMREVLPNAHRPEKARVDMLRGRRARSPAPQRGVVDRKSTRLNSSHRCISYAVFCLKKKRERDNIQV